MRYVVAVADVVVAAAVVQAVADGCAAGLDDFVYVVVVVVVADGTGCWPAGCVIHRLDRVEDELGVDMKHDVVGVQAAVDGEDGVVVVAVAVALVDIGHRLIDPQQLRLGPEMRLMIFLDSCAYKTHSVHLRL